MQACQETLLDLHVMIKEVFKTLKPGSFLFSPSHGSVLLLCAVMHEITVFSKQEG